MTDGANKTKQPAASDGLRWTVRSPREAAGAEERAHTLLAMCLFGEGRGESPEAILAIAQVIVNRARHAHRVFGSRAGANLAENICRVILKPRQFSCFLESDPNYPKIFRPLDYESPAVWQRCVDAAEEAFARGEQPDALTLNSDHYFDDSLQPPTWANPSKHTVQIGRLRFYRLYLPRPAAGAGFLLRISAADESSPSLIPAGDAAAPPSRRESSPPETSCRAAGTLLCASGREPSPRHRREVFGCGSPVSHPAPHQPSQRSPRLGLLRWFQRSRGLSSLPSGFVTRDLGFGVRDSGRPHAASRLSVLRDHRDRGTTRDSGFGNQVSLRALHGIRPARPLVLLLLRIAFTACSEVYKVGTVVLGFHSANPEPRVPSPGWSR